ncbi:hypothetical protein ABC974_07580 [Sphingomonas oligophenolica]|uniref:Uncharacterized protein n=1 Tax=Sphingomonas oligophenolica TaxID=301154 RepID=A0ABU9Y0Z7_9SPHN
MEGYRLALDLARQCREEHIGAMATQSESIASRSAKSAPVIMGRSAATGAFVLKPASKSGAISNKDARNAIRIVTGKKK